MEGNITIEQIRELAGKIEPPKGIIQVTFLACSYVEKGNSRFLVILCSP